MPGAPTVLGVVGIAGSGQLGGPGEFPSATESTVSTGWTGQIQLCLQLDLNTGAPPVGPPDDQGIVVSLTVSPAKTVTVAVLEKGVVCAACVVFDC